MRSEPATIDFTYGKNALFVRQTFAVLLGLPLNQEFTWAVLRAHACDPTNAPRARRLPGEGFVLFQWVTCDFGEVNVMKRRS